MSSMVLLVFRLDEGGAVACVEGCERAAAAALVEIRVGRLQSDEVAFC